jgi:hypothetical protein
MISTVEYSARLILAAPETLSRVATLTRELARQRPDDCRGLSSGLRNAAREFAVGCRRRGLTPEAMVLAIKGVFEELDHRVPSLADPMMLEHEPEGRPLYAECYRGLLSVCIESYFG